MSEATALARLDEYDPKTHNVLHPVMLTRDGNVVSEVLVDTVTVVPIDPAVDCYTDFRFANEREGKLALGGLGLSKLSAAAGIRWVESGVVEERTRRPDGHVYVRVRSTGAVLQPNGEAYLISAHKEIDTGDLAEQYASDIRKKAVREKKSITDAQVDAQVRERVLQVREHVLSLAESKAQNRVIRKLLTLRQVYTKQELQRPFVVPRLLVRPDLTDPRQLEEVRSHGRRAANELFGGASPVSSTQSERQAEVRSLPDRSSASRPAAADADASRPEGQSPADAEERGGGSEGKAEAAPVSGRGGAASAEPDDRLKPPKEDPIIEDGPPHIKGERMSRVAETDPNFLRGLLAGTRAAKKRELIEGWLRWSQPTLGT